MTGADPLAALWTWLSSWLSRDGGVNGPVVHRSDLKRMFSVHDTSWTQAAVISGLLHLYRRSGDDRWLAWAARLGDAQCARQLQDGHFRWAGHQDSRASLLVTNVLADCALLDLAEAMGGEERYIEVAERNLRDYVIAKLYRDALQGFAMAPFDYYAGRDRFILNMNSVAIEALVKLDRLRETDRHAKLVRTVGDRILSLCDRNGLPYSDLEPHTHIPLYTGLALRGLPFIPASDGVARDAILFLERMEDPETRLWFHKLEGETVTRYPVFVAGAGIVCNGLLDAGIEVDAERLLRFQAPSGAIRNFVGYDHRDNGRPRGSGLDVWEDVFPTPNWNAHAFHFLCRVLPPPDPSVRPKIRRRLARSRRYVCFESERVAAVVGIRPFTRGIAGLYVKRLRYGLVVPGPHSAAYWALRRR
jgi:hypothetical protein